MRRRIRAAALVLALVLALGTVAAATDTTETTPKPIDYKNAPAQKNGIQVAPLDSKCTVKFKDSSSEALTVTYKNTSLKENDMVIVLLLKSDKAVTSDTEAKDVKPTLTAGTIQYIDQADVETAGTVTFRVFPQNYSNGVIRVIASRTTEGKTETVLNEPVAAVNRSYLMGDANNDGAVTVADAAAALRYIVHLNSDGTIEDKYAKGVLPEAIDVNGDHALTVADAAAILKLAVRGDLT